MEVILDEKFYKDVSANFEKYTRDYDAAIRRAKELEQAELERISNAEHDYEILEKFGTIY